jgi:hypothetical protein
LFSNSSFVGLQLYSVLIMNCYHHTTHAYAFHIDTTTLADGTYELVLESESEQCEAQVNLTEVAKDLNQSSEEPKASYAQEGKPWSITLIFNLCNFYLHIWCCALSL